MAVPSRALCFFFALFLCLGASDAYTRKSVRRVLLETAPQDLPPVLDVGTSDFLKNANGLDAASADACSPNNPMNWWIVQFNSSYAPLLEDACIMLYKEVDPNFADIDQFVEEFMEVMTQYNDIGGTAVDYVQQLSEEEVEQFLDQVVGFYQAHNQTVCELVGSYARYVDMVTLKIGQSEMLDELRTYLAKYIHFIERNGLVSVEAATELWGLDRIDQVSGSDGQYAAPGDGAGTHVYIIDTGVKKDHVDYASRLGNGIDFVDNDGDADDCHGHGTHCAGTAVGTTYGVAKGATVHGVRVLSCSGGGTYAGIIDGVNWVASEVAANGYKAVASLSLGGAKSASLNAAVDSLFDAGVPVAVAASNANDDACNHSPASASKAFTVASSDRTDARSPFSSYGSCVQMFAPGSDILSSCKDSPSASCTKSGTSMATPHVAGAMSVYRGMHPEAPPSEVYAALESIAVRGKVSDPQGSPNLLLNTNFPPVCTPDAGVATVECALSEWSAWSECSVSCNGGSRSRTRSVTTEPTNCAKCPLEMEQKEPCNMQSCPQLTPLYEQSSGVWAMDYTRTRFSAAATTLGDGYTVACQQAISSLPFLSDAATQIPAADDNSYIISFADSKTFTFFGVAYDKVSVNTNGAVLFGNETKRLSADSWKQIPMVAGVLADLNPSRGGALSYEQLEDMFVVTFEAVPYYSGTKFSASFQIELHFATGDVAISYLYTLVHGRVAAGLSPGYPPNQVHVANSWLLGVDSSCDLSWGQVAPAPTTAPRTTQTLKCKLSLLMPIDEPGEDEADEHTSEYQEWMCDTEEKGMMRINGLSEMWMQNYEDSFVDGATLTITVQANAMADVAPLTAGDTINIPDDAEVEVEMEDEEDVGAMTDGKPRGFDHVNGDKTMLIILLTAPGGEPFTLSEDEFADRFFGTHRPHSVVNQFAKCSKNKFKPGKPNFGPEALRKGVVTQHVDMDVSTNSYGVVARAAVALVMERFGLKKEWKGRPSGIDFVLVQMPAGAVAGNGRLYSSANAHLNHWLSYYCNVPKVTETPMLKDQTQRPLVLHTGVAMHELGHNMNMEHGKYDQFGTGKNWALGLYGNRDTTGFMGNGACSSGAQCFSGPHTWQLGWYSDCQVDLDMDAQSQWEGQLIAIGDYDKCQPGMTTVIRIRQPNTRWDLYISFNRQVPGITDTAGIQGSHIHFGADYSFCHDGWFLKENNKTNAPNLDPKTGFRTLAVNQVVMHNWGGAKRRGNSPGGDHDEYYMAMEPVSPPAPGVAWTEDNVMVYTDFDCAAHYEGKLLGSVSREACKGSKQLFVEVREQDISRGFPVLTVNIRTSHSPPPPPCPISPPPNPPELAQGKPAAQYGVKSGAVASRAVDGDLTYLSNGWNKCTATYSAYRPWWRVDLGEPFKISMVEIWTRGDKGFKNADIRVGNTPNWEDAVKCADTGTALMRDPITWTGDFTDQFPCAAMGRYVFVVAEEGKKQRLYLCEVKVYGVHAPPMPAPPPPPPAVVLTDKPAAQSSTKYGAGAARAVDGDKTTQWRGSSCTHSYNEKDPWWSVDLEGRFAITAVGLWNRWESNRRSSHRLSGAEIRVGDSPNVEDATKCATAGDMSQTEFLQLPCIALGQYVFVVLPGDGRTLTLCEVTVSGVQAPPAPALPSPPPLPPAEDFLASLPDLSLRESAPAQWFSRYGINNWNRGRHLLEEDDSDYVGADSRTEEKVGALTWDAFSSDASDADVEAAGASANNFDLEKMSVLYFPTQRRTVPGGWDYRIWCVEAIGDTLPMPTAGTALKFKRNECHRMTLPRTFMFNGEEKTEIYIGTNGYLTFECDRDRRVSVPEFYERQRISAMYLELRPDVGGDVTYSSTDEMFVISFVDVPGPKGRGRYTFQYNLYWDGRIKMGWTQYSSTSYHNMVGVSTRGYPINFKGELHVGGDPQHYHCFDYSGPVGLKTLVPRARASPTQDFYRRTPTHSVMSMSTPTDMDPAGVMSAVDMKASEEELAALEACEARGEQECELADSDHEDGDDDEAGEGSRRLLGHKMERREHLQNKFDLDNKAVLWKPLPLGTGYELECTSDNVNDLTAEMGGAVELSIPHKKSQEVALTDGKKFPFFGVEYGSVHVSSSGYVNFEGGVDYRGAHRYWHFKYPQVSCYMVDLNPTYKGSIKVKQLEDRLVVAFTDIAYHRWTSSSNTFTTELFFDGHVRCSYGDVEVRTRRRVVVGVSGGWKMYYGNYVLRDMNSANVMDASCPITPTTDGEAGAVSYNPKDSAGTTAFGISSFTEPAMQCPRYTSLPIVEVKFSEKTEEELNEAPAPANQPTPTKIDADQSGAIRQKWHAATGLLLFVIVSALMRE